MIRWFLGLFKKKQKTLVCIRQSQTFHWPVGLGEQTPGTCAECGAAIFYEKQNEDYRKICNRCAGMF
jgi:hypothetical protein